MLKRTTSNLRFAAIVVLLMWVAFPATALSVSSPLATSPDAPGQTLQGSFIWAGDEGSKPPASRFVAFRRRFSLGDSKIATLQHFAYARYLCWINGRNVARGPSR